MFTPLPIQQGPVYFNTRKSSVGGLQSFHGAFYPSVYHNSANRLSVHVDVLDKAAVEGAIENLFIELHR